MAWKRIPGGRYIPGWSRDTGLSAFNTPSGANLDAVGEYWFAYGPVQWANSQSNTISSSGGKIHARLGTISAWSSGSTLRCGIQDSDATATPPLRPDLTYDVYGEISHPTTPTASAVNTFTMSSGSKTIAHNQLVHVLVEMTARGGTDTVGISTLANHGATDDPHGGWYTGGVFTHDGRSFGLVLESDGGVFGMLHPVPALNSLAPVGYHVNSTPDEHVLIFQVSEPVKVDSVEPMVNPTSSAAADFEVILYSDPLGTPTIVGSAVAVNASELQNATVCATGVALAAPGSEWELWPGRDYAVAVRPTSATSINWQRVTLASASHRELMEWGTTMRGGSRTNQSGAFGSLSTTVLPVIRMRQSHIWAAPSPRYFLGI